MSVTDIIFAQMELNQRNVQNFTQFDCCTKQQGEEFITCNLE